MNKEKTLRKLQNKKEKVVKWINSLSPDQYGCNVYIPLVFMDCDNRKLLELVNLVLGRDTNIKQNTSICGWHAHYSNVINAINSLNKNTKRNKLPPIAARRKSWIERHERRWSAAPSIKNKLKPDFSIDTEDFYRSPEWKRLRIDVLEAYGARCVICGRSPTDGIIIHVDHIKPLRTHPDLRLKFDNLQPLCNECNEGKGNRYCTDWRPHQKV